MLLEGLMPYFAALGPFRSERNAQLGLAQLRETNDVLPINPVDEGKPIADLMQQQNSGLIFSSVPWGVQRLLAVDDVGRQGAERSGVVEWHAMRDGRLGFVAYLNEPDFEARWSSRDYIDMVMSPTFALGAFECPAFVPKGAVAKISDEDLPMGDESLRVLRVSLQRSPDPVLLFSISQGELFSVPLDE